MIAPLLICTDLDRTLLPNGTAPESPSARGRFATVASHPEVALAYVTALLIMHLLVPRMEPVELGGSGRSTKR